MVGFRKGNVCLEVWQDKGMKIKFYSRLSTEILAQSVSVVTKIQYHFVPSMDKRNACGLAHSISQLWLTNMGNLAVYLEVSCIMYVIIEILAS